MTQNAKQKLVRVGFDKTSGNLIKFFRTNDKLLCRYTTIDSPLSKQLAAYTSIENDLIKSYEALHCINESIIENKNYPSIINYSLLVTSVVTYMKCFTTSDGRKTKLEMRLITNEKLVKVHEKVAEIRHRYFAHSGVSEYEMLSIIAILHPDHENKKVLTFDVCLSTMQNINKEIGDCMNLVNFVMEHVKNKKATLWNKLKEEVEALNIQDLYDRSILPDETISMYIPVTIRPWVNEDKYEYKIETKDLD